MRAVCGAIYSYSDVMPFGDIAFIPLPMKRLQQLVTDLYFDKEQRARRARIAARAYGGESRADHRRRTNPATPSLDKLAACIELRALLDEVEHHHALEARRLGASWAQLGLASGLARSSAKSRYDHTSVEARRASFKSKKVAVDS